MKKLLLLSLFGIASLKAMQESEQPVVGDVFLDHKNIIFGKFVSDGSGQGRFQELYVLPLDPKRNFYKRDVSSNTAYVALHPQDFESGKTHFPFAQFFNATNSEKIQEDAVNTFKQNRKFAEKHPYITNCISGACGVGLTALTIFFYGIGGKNK